MKRYVVAFLLFTVLFSISKAQEHMMFMKIPIDGTLSGFAAKMKAKGFTQIAADKNLIVMEGEFMGKECEIGLHGTIQTNVIWKVSVFLKKSYTSWYSLKSEYKRIVDSYTEKYGFPTDKYEFFSRPYYEGDGYEIQALKVGKCTYSNFWMNVEEGNIEISMTQSAKIKIGYEDLINGEKQEEEKQKQINDDI